MTWTLFEVTLQRAKEIRHKHDFLLPDEARNEQAAARQPLPYVETPEDVKRARADALERRLRAVEFGGRPVG